MKRLYSIILLILSVVLANAQGSGFGYMIDLGGSTFSQATTEYNQVIRSIAQNGFIRIHSPSGYNALQLMVGYKKERIPFRNYSDFLSADGNRMLQYNTDAQLRREAWKFCVIHQLQYGQMPGKFMYSINTGLFYEHTTRLTRNENNGDITYYLHNELVPNNLGFILGAEVRFEWFTIGYKMEKLFRDVLNHDYILSQELNLTNSTELRGIRLNPWMHYLCLGFNIDFFQRRKSK